MPTLISYLNQPELKTMYVKRARAHRLADEIRQGFGYWKPGSQGKMQGCAVGCTIHSSNHADYETLLGIPRQLAHLEDGIFEKLPEDKALKWPELFLRAVGVGKNLMPVYWKFMVWLLVDPVDGVEKYAREDGKKAIRSVAALYQRLLDDGSVSDAEWRSAANAANAAAYAANDAANAAANDAAYAANDAANDAATVKQAEKLLTLLRAA